MRRRWTCSECGKRPAIYFRRPPKYQGRKNNLIIKSDKRHELCGRCADSQFQSIKQAPAKWSEVR